MAPLLVVDAPSLLFRAFHALPDSIVDARKRPVNALLGTANLLLYAIEERRPRATVLCFGQDAATYRTEQFPAYHADRIVMPDGLGHQFAEAGDFFTAFGFEVAGTEDLEADDLLGSYAATEVEAGGEALLMTGDRDMFQCADERVTVLYVKTGTRGFEDVGPDQVLERYGVPASAVPDFIALRGDPSDGLPGARGIGAKTAADLLRRHGSLEGAIDAAAEERPAIATALREQADDLRAFKDIATLRRVAVPRPPDREVDYARAARAARALGMNRLAERLERLGDEAA